MEYIQAILDGADLPAFVLIVLLFSAIIAAQRMPQFWEGALQDDREKFSALRFMIFGSGITSSWLMIYFAIGIMKSTLSWSAALDALFPWFLTYTLVWSGAKAAEKLIDLLVLVVQAKFGIKLPEKNT